MNAVMNRVFAVGIAVSAAMLGSTVAGEPAVESAGLAGTCQRTVGIERQVSAGEGARTLTFSVHSGGCAAQGGVAYTVTAGTAQAAADFQLTGGNLQWAAGDLSVRLVSATIVPDLEPEAELEDFTVRLTTATADVRVANAIGQGRILDDDVHGPLWAVNDDGCGGLTPNQWCECNEQGMPDPVDCVVVELSLTTLSTGSAAARWTTVDGTARAGVDFVGVVDRMQPVPAGATTAQLAVGLMPRSAGTEPRWFYVRISGVSSGTIVDMTAIVTIEGP